MARYLVPAFVLVNAPSLHLAQLAAADLCLKVNAEKPLDQRTLRLCEASPTTVIADGLQDPTDLAGCTCDHDP